MTALRLMVVWRFVENVLGFLLVLTVLPVNPCTYSTSDVRYLSEYCITCCRGPIFYHETQLAALASSALYILTWFAGWFLEKYYFVDRAGGVDET